MTSVEPTPPIPSIAPTVGAMASAGRAGGQTACETCRHWDELRPDPNADGSNDGNYDVTEYGSGLCRRYPPSQYRTDMHFVPGGREAVDSLDAAASSYWPVTYAEDRCGEYLAPAPRVVVGI